VEFSTTVEKEKNRIVVSGEVDMASSPALRKQILDMIEQASDGIFVDLSKVGYMDSSGVATLVEGLKATNRKSLKFTLVAPSGPVMEVFRLTRLDTVFDILESA
jgi:anti-sigma B factor antagonist